MPFALRGYDSVQLAAAHQLHVNAEQPVAPAGGVALTASAKADRLGCPIDGMALRTAWHVPSFSGGHPATGSHRPETPYLH